MRDPEFTTIHMPIMREMIYNFLGLNYLQNSSFPIQNLSGFDTHFIHLISFGSGSGQPGEEPRVLLKLAPFLKGPSV
jgi:hypothetical protein